MGYIGNEPVTGHFPVQTNLVGPGPTYTLDRAPATAGAIEVSVQGVLQPTTAYSVSGTTLTMAGVASGIPLFIRYFGETITVPTIADGVVVETKIANDAVTSAKIATDAVTIAKLAATGTASSSTFLRGDNSWNAAGGGKVLQQTVTDIYAARAATTSTTLVVVHTDWGAAITPSATSSKILVQVQFDFILTGTADTASRMTVKRDATDISPGAGNGWYQGLWMMYNSPNTNRGYYTSGFSFLDSPSSTSELVYKPWWVVEHSGTTLTIGAHPSQNNLSYIYLTEIGA